MQKRGEEEEEKKDHKYIYLTAFCVQTARQNKQLCIAVCAEQRIYSVNNKV